MIQGSGATRTSVVTVIDHATGASTVKRITTRVPEYVELFIQVCNHKGGYTTVSRTLYDANSEYAVGSYTRCIIDAENQARFFGGPARLVDADGALVEETDFMPRERSARVRNLRYSGQDNDYSGDVDGYGFLNLIPNSFIYRRSPKSRTGWVLWSYVQSEIDAQKRLQESHRRESALRDLFRQRVRFSHLEPITIDDVGEFRYNDTTTDPYLHRWEMRQPDGSWDMPGVPTNELLDMLCDLETLSFNAYNALGRERREAQNNG